MKYIYILLFIFLSINPLAGSETAAPGTALNDEVYGTVTDIDGNVYRTVKIGEQWWMAENLRVKHYRHGDTIPYLMDDVTWDSWYSQIIGACCSYNYDEMNGKTFGLLYNWYAVNDRRSIAPEGWHVASEADWIKLEMFLGMSASEAARGLWKGTDEGGKLKEPGTAHWKSPNDGATDEFSFCALPGGAHFINTFFGLGSYAFFWTSTSSTGNYSIYRSLYFRYADIFSFSMMVPYGFSVRCIKD
jgi:uncharacterized protein (TIGR02145 family)